MSEKLYTIGEVSQILNISRDMIRYYEKRGVLTSKRDEKSNYRRYSPMDIFWLMEAVQYSSCGIEIGDISAIRSDSFIKKTCSAFDARIKELEEDAAYKSLLLSRLHQCRERLQLCLLNIGNFWIRQVPAFYECHFVTGKEDSYESISFPDRYRDFLLGDKIRPFVDSGFYCRGTSQDWVLILDALVPTALHMDVPDGLTITPQGLCLCTNADIGEIGQFRRDAEDSLLSWAKGHHYKALGDPRALLAARGRDHDRFRRIVEFQLPIEAS